MKGIGNLSGTGRLMNQLIREIKHLKDQLRQQFDPEKLVKLYNLVEELNQEHLRQIEVVPDSHDQANEITEKVLTYLSHVPVVGDSLEAMTTEDYDSLEQDLYDIVQKEVSSE